MDTQKHPIVIGPVAAQHLRKALREEIERLESCGKTLKPNDDWPDDYDPNDLSLFMGWDEWLAEAVVSGRRIDDPTLKQVELLMEFLPVYARKYGDSIPARDLEEVFRTYAEYVASFCASFLPEELVRQTSRTKKMQTHFQRLLSFPRTPNSAR